MVILLRIEVLFLTSSTEVCFFEVHSALFSSCHEEMMSMMVVVHGSVNETKTEHADNEYAFH